MALNLLAIWIDVLMNSWLSLKVSIIIVPITLVIPLVASTVAVILSILILLLIILWRILKILALRIWVATRSLIGIDLKSIIIILRQILTLVCRVYFDLRWFRLIIRLRLLLFRVGRFLLRLVNYLWVFFALVCWLLLVKLLWGHTSKIIERNLSEILWWLRYSEYTNTLNIV